MRMVSATGCAFACLWFAACRFDASGQPTSTSVGIGDEDSSSSSAGAASAPTTTEGSSQDASTSQEVTTSFTSDGASDASTDSASGDETETGDAICGVDLPPVGQCPASCTNACDGGVCEIECGPNACDAIVIECPDGWPCRVRCHGIQSCKDAGIVCPALHRCDVLCDGNRACQQTEVQCGDGTCALNCDGSDQACDQLVFFCGLADSTVTRGVAQTEPPSLRPFPASTCACVIEGSC